MYLCRVKAADIGVKSNKKRICVCGEETFIAVHLPAGKEFAEQDEENLASF